jgi:hypothetical protein
VAKVSTEDYNGKQCGTAQFGVLDRTAQDMYVELSGTNNKDQATLCAAFQSFKIASSGAISYLGSIIPYDEPSGTMNVYYYPPVFSGSNTYAYGTVAGLSGVCDEPEIVSFKRESSGALELAGTQSVRNLNRVAGSIFRTTFPPIPAITWPLPSSLKKTPPAEHGAPCNWPASPSIAMEASSQPTSMRTCPPRFPAVAPAPFWVPSPRLAPISPFHLETIFSSSI